MKGLFVVFEGPDGSSKTTQAAMLADWLERNGIEYLHTREPDGVIRNLLLDPENEGKLHPYADALLFAASRVNKYKTVIEPALEEGKVVICDRYLESSIVYQGIAQGVGMGRIIDTHELFLQDDDRVTILLIIPVETSIERMRSKNAALDRVEQRDIEFHKNVVQGYEVLADKYPHIKKIDATQSPEHVHAQVKNMLLPHLSDRGYKVTCP